LEEYQVIESRSIGADAILLIAAVLDRKTLEQLSALARSLGMEVLFEIHREEELDRLPEGAEIIGVNSRDLGDFSVSKEAVLEMAGRLPDDAVKVAESGIDHPDTLHQLRQAGYQGFLIGERFMREANPAAACRHFIRKVGALARCRESEK
jgi:indole-3-glycerol phosphate synthase